MKNNQTKNLTSVYAKRAVTAAHSGKLEDVLLSSVFLHRGFRLQFRSHQRELIINRQGLDPSLLRHNEALYFRNIRCFSFFFFFRLLVATSRLTFLFSVSSDNTSPDMTALGIQHEYSFFFLNSNSKLERFFFPVWRQCIVTESALQ